MTIKEIIASIDELRSKATKGEWKAKGRDLGSWGVEADGNTVFDDGSAYGEYSPECNEDDRDYIVALHSNYEALRQAALEGEQYKKAGEELAKAVERVDCFDSGSIHLVGALAIYRQATEQKDS